MSNLTINDFQSVPEMVSCLSLLQYSEGFNFCDLEEDEIYIFGTMNVVQVAKNKSKILRFNLNFDFLKEDCLRKVYEEAIYYKLSDVLESFKYADSSLTREELSRMTDFNCCLECH